MRITCRNLLWRFGDYIDKFGHNSRNEIAGHTSTPKENTKEHLARKFISILQTLIERILERKLRSKKGA